MHVKILGLSKIAIYFSLAILTAVIFTIFSYPSSFATGGIVSDQFSCNGIGGTWHSTSNSCTVTSLTINSGETLTIASITLDIQGTVTNLGTLNTNSSGIISNSGTINNSGGTITNSGGIIANNLGGTITNSGSINNNMILANMGTIINNSNGTIINSGIINNNPGGTITNIGVMKNNLGGVVNNGGTIVNNSGGTIINYSVDTINNNSGGTITDAGIVNSTLGSVITNFGNISVYCGGNFNSNGTLFGNLIQNLCVNSGDQDTSPPTIVVSSGISAEATSTAGAQVSYTVTATDNVGVTSGPTCNPASGSVFPLGNTTVTCTASDASGNNGTGSFNVNVRDTTPPVVNVPADIKISTLSPTGIQVSYTVTATDNVGVTSGPTCNPASGTVFPLGNTTVTCTASDASGNNGVGLFKVSVTDATVATSLSLNPIANVPWSSTITVSGKLTNIATGIGVANKTISFNGTGAINLQSTITNGTGFFVSSAAAPSIVSTGLTVQANFAKDSTYVGSKSQINAYATIKHGIAIWATSQNAPWSTANTITANLQDLVTGSHMSGKTVHFNGTGVAGVSDQITNSNGQAIGTITAPSNIATGWTYQVHFAGDSLYVAKDSTIGTYSTLKHTTGLTIALPGSVVHGNVYSITGVLTDLSTGTPLTSTITFTATSPIVIPNALTDGTGRYTVSGLTAPSAGTYNIQANYAGNPNYLPSSITKTLNVT